MTPTDQDDMTNGLMADLERQLRTAGDRVVVPSDGRSKVSGRVKVRRTRRRSRAAVAVLASVAVLVVGVAVIRDRTGEQAEPVFAGPGGGIQFPVQPLAPEGVDWHVDAYAPTGVLQAAVGGGEPGGATGAYSIVGFERSGYDWSLMVQSAPMQDGSGGSGDEVREVNGNEVHFRRNDSDPTKVNEVWWIDPSGDTVDLVGRSSAARPLGDGQPAEGDGSTPVSVAESGVDLLPTADQALEVSGLVGPVDDATWIAALTPPEGAADPENGSTVRPLRLGLADPDAMRLFLKPWTDSIIDLDVAAFPAESFRLQVSAPGSTYPVDSASAEGATTEPVEIRGVQGQLVDNLHASGGPWTSLTPDPERALIWDEGGSHIRLSLPDGVTTDQGLAVASSLTVLDDAKWDALLFAESSAGQPPQPPSAPHTEGLSLDRSSPNFLPPLAPTGVDWRILGYTTDGTYVPPGYQEDFTVDGVSWRLMVQPGPAIDQQGLDVQVGERTARLLGGATLDDLMGGAQWTDPSGALVMLVVLDVLDPSYNAEVAPTFDGVTGHVVVDMIERIQTVSDDEWYAALSPPDHVPDSSYTTIPDDPRFDPFDATRRPVKLGLRNPAAATHLYVQPWDTSQAYLAVDGVAPESFRLGVKSTDLTGFNSAAPVGESVMVRGVAATLVTRDPASPPGQSGLATFFDLFPWTGIGVLGFNRAITWQEDGSTIRLEMKDDVTIEQAVAVANSLVVLHDDEWAELLGFQPTH